MKCLKDTIDLNRMGKYSLEEELEDVNREIEDVKRSSDILGYLAQLSILTDWSADILQDLIDSYTFKGDSIEELETLRDAISMLVSYNSYLQILVKNKKNE